ncbi:MAG TPA: hypothetical protein VH912_19295 [Streptosporangiaceae bacterium]
MADPRRPEKRADLDVLLNQVEDAVLPETKEAEALFDAPPANPAPDASRQGCNPAGGFNRLDEVDLNLHSHRLLNWWPGYPDGHGRVGIQAVDLIVSTVVISISMAGLSMQASITR